MTTKNILLAFGDESFSSMIIGYCPLKDTLSALEIQKSVLSIYYDSSKIVDPFEIARFEIDLSDTDYQFYRYASNTYMYAKGGKEEENPLQTHFLVSQVPSVGIDDYAIIKYANSLIKSFEESGVPPITIVKSEPANIKGFKGYLIIGETIFQSKPISIYELVITNDETTATFTGFASENIEKDMKMFERIGNTFKIKKSLIATKTSY